MTRKYTKNWKYKDCKNCEKVFMPASGRQVYCGSRKIKGSCSYLYYLKATEILRKKRELITRKKRSIIKTLNFLDKGALYDNLKDYLEQL